MSVHCSTIYFQRRLPPPLFVVANVDPWHRLPLLSQVLAIDTVFPVVRALIADQPNQLGSILGKHSCTGRPPVNWQEKRCFGFENGSLDEFEEERRCMWAAEVQKLPSFFDLTSGKKVQSEG